MSTDPIKQTLINLVQAVEEYRKALAASDICDGIKAVTDKGANRLSDAARAQRLALKEARRVLGL